LPADLILATLDGSTVLSFTRSRTNQSSINHRPPRDPASLPSGQEEANQILQRSGSSCPGEARGAKHLLTRRCCPRRRWFPHQRCRRLAADGRSRCPAVVPTAAAGFPTISTHLCTSGQRERAEAAHLSLGGGLVPRVR
jgi:hypothetical protein